LIVQEGLLSAAQVAELLTPEALISPREMLSFTETIQTAAPKKDFAS
jgi:hypothetical protein